KSVEQPRRPVSRELQQTRNGRFCCGHTAHGEVGICEAGQRIRRFGGQLMSSLQRFGGLGILAKLQQYKAQVVERAQISRVQRASLSQRAGGLFEHSEGGVVESEIVVRRSKSWIQFERALIPEDSLFVLADGIQRRPTAFARVKSRGLARQSDAKTRCAASTSPLRNCATASWYAGAQPAESVKAQARGPDRSRAKPRKTARGLERIA